MDTVITVAAAHLAPVYLNASATIEKACRYVEEAADKNVDLVVFPESFVPGFPIWPALAAPIDNHDYFKNFAAQSIRVPGPEIFQLCAAARKAGIMVSVGISESTDHSVGCLWNSNLLIGRDGSILNHHRKLVPTFFEKMVWANGDGTGLQVTPTDIGRVGALICGENTNPLARFSLMAQGEQLHISTYPPIWPTHEPSQNQRYDLVSAIRIRAGAHSFEAKVFNVVAAARLDDDVYECLSGLGERALNVIRNSPKGVSMIIGPDGLPIAETSNDEDQLLIETINLDDCVTPKQFHDVVGYYNRFDIFDLAVNRHDQSPAKFEAEGEPSRSVDFAAMQAGLFGDETH